MNFQEEANAQEVVTVTDAKDNELTPEYVLSQIVKIFTMLKNTNAPKGKRYSIKGIWNTLTNIAMPKKIGTKLREELEGIGFIGGSNGSIATFKNLEQYRCLIPYAIFKGDTYMITDVYKDKMSPIELKMYKEAEKMEEKLPKESQWSKRLEKLDLEQTNIGLHGEYIQVVGEPLEDLESIQVDIPEVTRFLPEGASLIKYRNTAYLYVTTPCMLELTLKNLQFMEIDITPIFYQTFEGGVNFKTDIKYGEETGKKSFPPCEDLPRGSHFESFPDYEMALAINSFEAYISLIKKGIYQRWNEIEDWGDYGVYINHYFLPSTFDGLTDNEAKERIQIYILPAISDIEDIELLEFIKIDLPEVLTVKGEDLILAIIDYRLDELKSLTVD